MKKKIKMPKPMKYFDEIGEFVFMCTTCGKEVPSGIRNISGHWVGCSGKEFSQAIMKMAHERCGKLTELEVNGLRKKTHL